MRTIARAVPPRPVLITAVALTTTAGSLPAPRATASYATGNPLLTGHWRTRADGSGGPADGAGRPSVVSGRHAVLFGTEPLFRDHPQGELPQVGRALFTMAHTSDGARAMAHASSGSVEESG